jgi:ABC-2 type transport system permease protein
MVQPYIGSAAYLSRKSLIAQVQVNLLYHPGHDYNLNEFEQAIGAGIAFINTELGVYPYPELRVAEIPHHQKDSYAMAGAIALSEKEGWYGDRNVGEIRGYIQYVLARDLIRQWIAANSFIPDVQGADMIWTALPGALALQVVDSRVGAREVEALFVKMRKTYHKDRTNEPIREPPLIFADNIDYLEANKGTMALYKLAGAVGYDRFNRFVGEWITQSSGPLVFHEFYEKVKQSWKLDPALCRLFEVVEDQVAL